MMTIKRISTEERLAVSSLSSLVPYVYNYDLENAQRVCKYPRDR